MSVMVAETIAEQTIWTDERRRELVSRLRRRMNLRSGVPLQMTAWMHDFCVALAEQIKQSPGLPPQCWVEAAVADVTALRGLLYPCPHSLKFFLEDADLALSAVYESAGLKPRDIYSGVQGATS